MIHTHGYPTIDERQSAMLTDMIKLYLHGRVVAGGGLWSLCFISFVAVSRTSSRPETAQIIEPLADAWRLASLLQLRPKQVAPRWSKVLQCRQQYASVDQHDRRSRRVRVDRECDSRRSGEAASNTSGHAQVSSL